MRVILALAILALAACSSGPLKPTGPAGEISSTDRNPITGSRGGTN
jgi:hypothetical protein